MVTAEGAVPVGSNMLIILTCFLCALICVVGLMAVTRCMCDCDQSPATTAEAVSNKCLKRNLVKSLPRRTFKSDNQIVAAASENHAAECVICLAEFVDGEEIREFPGCFHVFHVECIDTWLIRSDSSSCPSCRQALVVDNQCQTCSSVVSQQQEADFLP